MNELEQLLEQIRHQPESIEFSEVIHTIDENYRYTPVRFSNGPVSSGEDEGIINQAGENEGSCKIFAFGRINDLTADQTLHCFGRYYRDDVLGHPDKNDHQNIRLFIKFGWPYIRFDVRALEETSS